MKQQFTDDYRPQKSSFPHLFHRGSAKLLGYGGLALVSDAKDKIRTEIQKAAGVYPGLWGALERHADSISTTRDAVRVITSALP